jgi:acyl-CoA synthetase (AMP-forming)/AMP-acid ligase II
LSAAPAAARAAAYDGLPHDRFRWVGDAVRYWADAAPARIALGDPLTTLTYAQLEALVETTRARLAALGAGAGDRVLIVLENSVLAVVAVLAAARLRAWAVPINARLSAGEVDTIRAHCSPRVTVYTAGVSAEARAHGERHGAAGDDLLASLGGLIALLPDSAPEPASEDPAGQVAALIYTSGTSGEPKGVMLTHDNLIASSARSSRARRLSAADRVYGVLPVSHIFGLASMLLGTLHQGGRLDLVARFAPAEAASALAEDGITVFQGVPQMHARLLALAKTRARPLAAPHLRYVSTGGAPLDLALKQQIEAMWGLPLHHGYGLSETSAAVSLTTIDRPATDHSCGPPLPDVEVRIAAPDGSALPHGEVGEILVRSRAVMQGYYRDPALTAAILTPDRWLRTGDLGHLGPTDELYVEGRRKELIIRSGFNVYPPEVEGVLTAHPDVALSAVLGRPVAGNEEVVAFVQPVPGRTLSLPDLAAFVAQRLAPYKRPGEYRVLAELPATSTGKLLKARLKELL